MPGRRLCDAIGCELAAHFFIASSGLWDTTGVAGGRCDKMPAGRELDEFFDSDKSIT